ncbi:hypothetical protein EZ428_15130 [Pedobacter frigiditerrae]|uniref:Uncharacterized protein n=1 Tax=Pedobacter frigiditerrae TaxID=2530452 RepID=A0A4R0MV04_9SPHI|nr:hypothetical protein [Pedobacter frigiditerrae]TCC90597.1 hypothetical protein EZ428_15130 [Pedobacter frigiditerrae]
MKTNKSLIILLVISTMLSVYALMKKGKASPAIDMVLFYKNRKKVYDRDSTKNYFWNNYPFVVLTSEGKKIDSTMKLMDANLGVTTFKKLTHGKPKIIFKYTNKSLETVNPKSILEIIDKLGMNDQVYIITNFKNSPSEKDSLIGNNKIRGFKTSKSFGSVIEKTDLPFIFLLSSNYTIEKIFVPRKEIPEVTEKYLKYLQRYL